MRNITFRSSIAIATLLLVLSLCASSAFGAPLPTISRSLSIGQATDLAAQSNLSIKAARDDDAVASAGAPSAKALAKPSVSATTFGTLGDSANIVSSPSGAAPQDILAVSPHGLADQNVSVMVPLFTGSRLSGQVESARLQSVAARYGIGAAELTVESDVAHAYAQALVTAALLDVARSKTDVEEEQVRVTKAKVDTGAAAPIDLLQEQAELASAQQAQREAENNADLAVIDLKTELGIDLGSSITLTDTLDSALSTSPAMPASCSDAVAQAMRSRPEVLALKATAEARQADVHAAQGAYAPQVFGLGMVDSNASADGGGRTGYTVGIAATIPLYDGGAHSADIDAARAKAGRSQTDVAIMQQTIAQQVNTAWLQLQLEKDEVMSATAEVAAANEAYRLADLRYNAGKSTLSERLASLAERTRAAGALAQSKGDLLSAQAALLASIGKNQAPS